MHGYLNGPGARAEAGLPPEAGPFKVITDLCIMGFDSKNKQMIVDFIHPGVEREDILRNTGFELLWNKNLKVTSEPTDGELTILRNKVDPRRYVIDKVTI